MNEWEFRSGARHCGMPAGVQTTQADIFSHWAMVCGGVQVLV
jgi:hypothetical protein